MHRNNETLTKHYKSRIHFTLRGGRSGAAGRERQVGGGRSDEHRIRVRIRVRVVVNYHMSKFRRF